MPTVFVLDTGYLCEIYRVPRHHDPALSRQIRQRIRDQAADRFFLPLGCLYQLCDHIGKVPDDELRRQLAQKFVEDVATSLSDSVPWLIVPAADLGEGLLDLLQTYRDDPLHLRMGLTDSTVVREANRLKEQYGDSTGYRVHIWTTDSSLKAYEPDQEPDAILPATS